MSILQLQLTHTHTHTLALVSICVFLLLLAIRKNATAEKNQKKIKKLKTKTGLQERQWPETHTHTHTEFITHTCASVCVYSKCEQSVQIKPRNVTNAQLANLNRIERSHKLELGLGHINVEGNACNFFHSASKVAFNRFDWTHCIEENFRNRLECWSCSVCWELYLCSA